MFFFIKSMWFMLPVLMTVAFFTIFERKLLGAMQSSKGPNIMGWGGLLQPFSDAMKLLLKETMLPTYSNYLLFIIIPNIAMMFGLMNFVLLSFDWFVVLSDMNLGLLYMLIMSSLNVFIFMIAGWVSNCKYAMMGSLSSIILMLSYELVLGLMWILILMFNGSLNVSNMMLVQKNIWNFIVLFPMFLMFMIMIFVETCSTPFDLPEAEGELVSGYNIEYSGMLFVFFFMTEYLHMMSMSMILVMMFLGGWFFWVLSLLNFYYMIFFLLKMLFVIFLYVWMSASLPSYSGDQMMIFGWKLLLPMMLSYLMLFLSYMYMYML